MMWNKIKHFSVGLRLDIYGPIFTTLDMVIGTTNDPDFHSKLQAYENTKVSALISVELQSSLDTI